jgi:hypothetical protein
MTTPKSQRYDLQIPMDIHWELVKLGANSQLDYETYAKQLLIRIVEHSRQKSGEQSKQLDQ